MQSNLIKINEDSRLLVYFQIYAGRNINFYVYEAFFIHYCLNKCKYKFCLFVVTVFSYIYCSRETECLLLEIRLQLNTAVYMRCPPYFS